MQGDLPGQRLGRPKPNLGVRLMAALNETADWRAASDVAAASGMSRTTIHTVLLALECAGVVERRAARVGVDSGRGRRRFEWRLLGLIVTPCEFCGVPVTQIRRGRPRLYCSAYCKCKASRCRRAA